MHLVALKLLGCWCLLLGVVAAQPSTTLVTQYAFSGFSTTSPKSRVQGAFGPPDVAGCKSDTRRAWAPSLAGDKEEVLYLFFKQPVYATK